MNPAPKRPRYDAPGPVMRAAGAWLSRRDRGLDAAEQAEFERWRAADPRHAAAVAQLDHTMTAFDRLRAFAPADAMDRAPDPDFFASHRHSRRRGLPRLVAAVALAAAACLAVVVFRPASESAVSQQRFSTSTLGAERAALADGSFVSLNRDSLLVTEFTATERRVRLLRGEAHFEVEKNPARPFIVVAGPVNARAVGTAFRVRLSDAQVDVLVTSGRVQVAAARAGSVPPAVSAASAPSDDLMVLGPGFRAVVSRAAATTPAAPRVVQLTSEEIDRELSWQPRLFDLSNASLADIVAECNRRGSGSTQPRLVLGDPALADLRIGGTIYLEQPEAFVRLLEKSFGIRVERRGDALVLHRAP